MKKIFLPIFFFSSLIISGCTLLTPAKKETVTTTATIMPTSIIQEKTSPTVVENPMITGGSKTSGGVPLPTGKDIVRTFFNLINEKRIPEAVSMLDQSTVPDDSAKQAWGVQFNSISQVIVKSIEDYNKTEWSSTEQTFKVILTMKMNPDSANAPIPYYGYENGDNVRWITIRKNNQNLWKIMGIATGP